MCRFTFYLGAPIRLNTLLLEPAHSLIRQSSHSLERAEPLNGDGFGVGWYAQGHSPVPAVFRSITPAWNNRNLHNLARVVASDCVMAHVRAASRSSVVNDANCHPFRYQDLLCMHNGDIGQFKKVRRRMLQSVSDEAFNNVYGSTDTEHFFAVFIDAWAALADVEEPSERLATALEHAIARVVKIVREYGDGAPSYLNVVVTDGQHAVASRYVDGNPGGALSLYYHVGNLYPVEYRRRASDPVGAQPPPAVLVSSERLTSSDAWREVPENHMIILNRAQAPRVRACSVAA
ncbi:MAG: glutamine amidotransferase [Gammaproteobacteria bacterium]|jgi:glutamine amidotransferase